MTEAPPPFPGCLGRVVVLLVALAAAFGVALAAQAHRPWFNDAGSPNPAKPYVLEDLGISQVIYGGFDGPGRVDYYALDAPQGFAADVQLVVPDVPACAAFRPVLIVFGKGLPADTALPDGFEAPPAVTKAKLGALVRSLPADQWGSFYEPFTRTTYAMGPTWSGSVAAGGYLLAVYEPEGDSGTYGLSLGGAERPGGDPRFLELGPRFEQCEPPTLPATPGASPES